jgi:hypothetical protein
MCIKTASLIPLLLENMLEVLQDIFMKYFQQHQKIKKKLSELNLISQHDV